VRRASPKIRREWQAAHVDGVNEQRAIIHRTAAEVVREITGLVVTESTTAATIAQELLVEVAFIGTSNGRLAVGFSRGLTRQVGASMASMVDLEGRPLNPMEAAKELSSALIHALIVAIFGADSGLRIQVPQMIAHRQIGAQASVLNVADGQLVIDLHIDTSGI
jgi:hypothetical protein